ncbi:hypothetical protein UlMin_041794 [Ulmus minor]
MSKVYFYKKPRCPYEKERLDTELKLVGEYGIWCKRELWRKNPQSIFEGKALFGRMNMYVLLDESQNKLDYVLALTVENFLERHLQTFVFKSGMAKSIQYDRVLIKQRHISSGAQIGKVKRVTKETNVSVKIHFDGYGIADSSTGIPFLDHMLDVTDLFLWLLICFCS